MLDSNSAGVYGGGIMVYATFAPSAMLIVQSTLSHNFAQYGGGIYYNEFVQAWSTMAIVNSTLSGNNAFRPGGATGTSDGGGIYAIGTAHISIFNATIASNVANSGRGVQSHLARGGGLFITATALITVLNTLIGDNVESHGIDIPTADDCFGPLRSLGYNLIETTSNCAISGTATGNIYGQDPKLGSLQDNGGSTPTQALLSSSPSIDMGNPGGCTNNTGATLAIDQRGFARPFNGRCDIGAYELNNKTDQRITFPPIPNKTIFDSPFTLSAIASSGLPVTYTSSGA